MGFSDFVDGLSAFVPGPVELILQGIQITAKVIEGLIDLYHVKQSLGEDDGRQIEGPVVSRPEMPFDAKSADEKLANIPPVDTSIKSSQSRKARNEKVEMPSVTGTDPQNPKTFNPPPKI